MSASESPFRSIATSSFAQILHQLGISLAVAAFVLSPDGAALSPPPLHANAVARSPASTTLLHPARLPLMSFSP